MSCLNGVESVSCPADLSVYEDTKVVVRINHSPLSKTHQIVVIFGCNSRKQPLKEADPRASGVT